MEALVNAKIDTKTTYTRPSGSVSTLANSIVRGAATPYSKILAIEKYIKNNYKIGESKSTYNQSQDAVTRFLFSTDRKGTYLDFVSAYTYLLRCVDIPARMVTGYKIDPSKNYQIVYADQLYVYTEVKFEKYGWVPLDSFRDNSFYVPTVETETNITSLDRVAQKGANFSVKGTVTDKDGKPVNELQVLIYLKKYKDEECISYSKGSVNNGLFDISCGIKHDVDVGNYQVVAQTLESDIYKASWSDPEMKVVAETNLSVTTPKIILEGRPFTITGRLYEEFSDKSVANTPLEFIFDDSMSIVNALKCSTGRDGSFKQTLTLNIDKDVKPSESYFVAGKYKGDYVIIFPGNEMYLPSQKSDVAYVWRIFWDRILIISVVLLIVSASIILLFMKHKKKIKRFVEVAGTGYKVGIMELQQNVVQTVKPRELKISFPSLNSTFPSIWGINEPLVVRFSDETENFDEITIIFDKKGEKKITVYSDSEKEFAGNANIRIVDYREEIVLLGKTLLKKICDSFRLARHKLTPREILHEVCTSIDQEALKALEKMIGIFEKATYSRQEMDRQDYESFYSLYIHFSYSKEEEK